jgi:hypothetical protein
MRVRVLVTVKAYPTLSADHGEAICVAGVRLDTSPVQWVRLFPIPFRDLPRTEQFKKYDVIEIDVQSPNPKDARPESVLPIVDTISVVDHIGTADGWAKRASIVGPVVASSLCRIRADQQSGGVSLGLFRPATVADLRFEVAAGRSAGKDALAGQMNLFNPQKRQLEPLPWKFKYTFRCAESDCPGHESGLIDWEIGEAYRRWRLAYRGVETLKQKMRQTWLDDMLAADRDLYFFTGNIAKYPQSFVLLGCFYPKTGLMDRLPLF